MRMSGNTILITGGGSGIGRGLAEAFQRAGNEVVIAGRRQTALDEVTAANPGMRSLTLDIESAEGIKEFGERIGKEFPKLNVVIHNAGIMRNEDVRKGETADAEATIATNLLGPIRLTAALLPLLEGQAGAAILTVSSGLASVPLWMTPTYCATKAAIHSWTQSLRYQLREAGVQVIELVPPYVQTELMGARQAKDPNAMPLTDYIAETMKLLASEPEPAEILVERVKPQRFAEREGRYDAFYAQFSEAMAKARAGEMP